MDKEEIQTKSDNIFFEDVKKLITAGDFSSAISKLLLELTSNSNNIELLYLLSVSYRYNKNYSKAIESLKSLFALNPEHSRACLLYTSPSPRDRSLSRMPSSA